MLKCEMNKGEVRMMVVSGSLGEIMADYTLLGKLIYDEMNNKQKEMFVEGLRHDGLLFDAISGKFSDAAARKKELKKNKKLIDELDAPDYVKDALRKMLDEGDEEE